MANGGAESSSTSYLDLATNYMGDTNNQDSLAGCFQSATPKYSTHQIDGYPNFWQVGCVFDTILDYYLALEAEGRPDPVAGQRELLVEQAVAGYQYGIVGQQANWYDDWCWWGIAACKAFDAAYDDIFGDRSAFFQSAALDLWGLVDAGDYATLADSIDKEIWDASGAIQTPNGFGPWFSKDMLTARGEIHKGTRNSWARILAGASGGTSRDQKDYEKFTSTKFWAEPRYPGGCWQYDFSSVSFPVGDGPNGFWIEPSPFVQNLGVFQVTLMQGLYLSFCLSLEEAALRKAAKGESGGAWDRLQPASVYRQKATEVVGFLGDWINNSPPLVDSYGGDDKGLLLYERVPTYADTGGTAPPVRNFMPGFFWAGDQGLVMGALKQYGANAPAEASASSLEAYVPQLLKGMFYNMSPAGPIDPFLGAPPDSGDYDSGSGIFWRYVLRCCRLDPSFSAEVRNDPTMARVTKTSASTTSTSTNALFAHFDNVAAALGAWAVYR